MHRFALVVGILVALTLGTTRGWAHAAPHSIVLFDLRANDAGIELQLPTSELEDALGRPFSTPGALDERERATVRDLVARDLHLSSPDGAAWRLEVGDVSPGTNDLGPVVVVLAQATPPDDHSPRVFDLVDDVIGKSIANHNAWIGVRSDVARDVGSKEGASGSPAVLGITHYLNHTVHVDRGPAGASQVSHGFGSLFRLGMQHIAEGTDHLLFLFALLLPAPFALSRTGKGGKRWGEPLDVRTATGKLLRLVTAFTLGHSLTLLIGAMGWLRLPSAPIETVIALSVLITAVHAARPLFPGREGWIAAGFGLVHGLAFASALAELNLAPGRLALALLGFNLGIEAMQLAVVAVTFPWILLLARTRFHGAFRIAGATVAGVAAIGWAAERAFGLPNPLDPVLSTLAAHPLVLLSTLVALALGARLTSRSDTSPAPLAEV